MSALATHSRGIVSLGTLTVLTSSVMQPNKMVHLDTSDRTRWPQQPIFMALRLWLLNSADLVYHASSILWQPIIMVSQSINSIRI